MFVTILLFFYLNKPKSLQKKKKQNLLFSISTKINQTLTNIKPNKFYSQIQSNPQLQTSNLSFMKLFPNPNKTQIFKYQKVSS